MTLYRRLLESRADIAQGTRSIIGRLRDSRLVLSAGLNLMLNVAFRTWATDSKSGFVLAPRRVLRDVVSYRGDYRYFQTFISVAAKAKGYAVLEVETLFATDAPASRSSPAAPRSSRWGRSRTSRGGRRSSAASAIPTGRRSRRTTVRSPGATVPYDGWRRAMVRELLRDHAAAQVADPPARALLYLELKRTERMPREELDALQLRKLQRLVQHAYVHVPFYRDRIGEERACIPRTSASLERHRQAAAALEGRRAQAPLLRPLRRQPPQARDAAGRDERLDRRAVRDVRRSLPARDALRDDAARARVDRLAVRRPPGAALAPDARHDATQGVRERIDALFMRRLFVPRSSCRRRRSSSTSRRSANTGRSCSTATPSR